MSHKKFSLFFAHRSSFYSAIIFFGTLCMLSMGYAAYNLSTESSWAQLTSAKWNAVINAVNDADTRIASLSWTVATLQAAGGSFWNAVTGGIGYSGWKVGVGTTSPNKDLHIYNTTTNAEIDIQSVAGADKHWGIYQNSSDETLRFWNNAGGDALVLTKDGKVGVSNPTPSDKLDVSGRIVSTIVANDNNKHITLNGYLGNTWNLFWWHGGGGYFWISENAGAPYFAISTTSGYAGNVGIGTTNPIAKFQVNWGAVFGTTTWNQRWVHFDQGSNTSVTQIGLSAGDGWSHHGTITYFGSANADVANRNALVISQRYDWDIAFMNNNGSDRLRILNNGNILIWTTTDSGYKLDVNGTVRGTSWTNSDWNLKKNIETLTGWLDKILSIRGVTYDWKDPSRGTGAQVGVIAQEVESVFPELVNTDTQWVKAVNYAWLVAPLIEAIKEQQREIASLKQEVLLLQVQKE